MGAFLRKYATATASGTHVGIPMVVAGSQNFAVSADWTPATGDVKVSIDGGTQANIGTLPAYTNGQWLFQFTIAELTGKSVRVVVADAATKAVEDQFFIVETFGNASAMFTVDWTVAGGKIPATVATGDDADAATLLGRVPGTVQPQTGDAYARLGAAGAGLTALGDARLANLDAAVSTRGTSNFSGGAVASVTAAVTVATNNDKNGYALAATGLDAIPVTDPGGVSGQTTFPRAMMALYRRFLKKVTKSTTQIKAYADDGVTVNTTQAITDDGAGNQTQGAAT